jgi:signal transduction histidine kinase
VEQSCEGVPRSIQVQVIASTVVFSAVNVWGRYDADPGGLLALDIAAGLIGCALLPFVFRRPMTGALTLAVLAALSPGATPPSTVATNQVAQSRTFRLALLAACAGAGGHLVQGLWRPIPGLPLAWFVILDLVLHAALLGWGQWSQARRQLVWSLRERAERAEAEQGRRIAEARTLERTRMAREMHDVLAHRLSLLATYAGALEYRPDSSPDRLAEAAGVIRTGVHQALDELRQVIGVLRDDSGAELTGPQPTLADLDRLVEESRHAGTDVDYRNTAADAASVPPATGRTAYRVVQEGLTNARKHAGGSAVDVRVSGRPGGPLTIEIVNPAQGGIPAVPGSGTGLVGLTERVKLAGGTLDHGATGGRFVLRASLPWPG